MKQFDVAIAIVCNDVPQVIICRRKPNGHLGGFWEFPGGKVEPGETPVQSLVRELREELDIEVNPIIALATIEHEYPDRSVRLFPFICTQKSGDPKPLGCEQVVWVRPVALRNYLFPPANAQLIEELITYFDDSSAPPSVEADRSD
jgi:mutator protein MutT